ncbi:hypothetical protein ACHZ98_33690 [Streptomyces sp. MAR4 CNY-716]
MDPICIRFRWIAAGTAVAALTLAFTPVLGLQIGQAGSASLASSGKAHETLKVLSDGGVDSGVLTPMAVLVEPDSDSQAIASAAENVDEVRMAVVAEPGADGTGEVVVVPEQRRWTTTASPSWTPSAMASRTCPATAA